MTLHKPSEAVWTDASLKTAEEVDAKFPRPDWTSTYPGHGEIYPAINGQGNRGQYAIDFMVGSKTMGDAIADYVWANRKRLGVRYVIWFKRIRSETRDGEWHPYVNPVASKRGTASGDHTNHVHVSRFSNKGYTAPEGAAPAPAKPEVPVVYLDKLIPGQKDSDSVRALQHALKVPVTGNYDAATIAAALPAAAAWFAAAGLTVKVEAAS